MASYLCFDLAGQFNFLTTIDYNDYIHNYTL